MKVYHGSSVAIEEVDLDVCRTNTDFGQGFYVTNIRSQAEYWAERMERKHKTKGVVTAFEFLERAWKDKDLRTLRFSDYSEEWLDFVVSNRNEDLPGHNYDIVEGPVANDKIASRIGVYLRGKVSKIDFLEELRHHEPTHQICFCTVKSLQLLERAKENVITDVFINIGNISADILVSLASDYGMTDFEVTDMFYNSKTFEQLVDASAELHKKPWEVVYEMLKQELKL
jgi:hypothetical protein